MLAGSRFPTRKSILICILISIRNTYNCLRQSLWLQKQQLQDCERCWSARWHLKQQQLQRLGALLERSVASDAASVTSGNVAGASCGLRSRSCSAQECGSSVAATQKQQAVAGSSSGPRFYKNVRKFQYVREPLPRTPFPGGMIFYFKK